MCTKKHILYFLSGAAFLHTLGHIMIAFTGLLPIHIIYIFGKLHFGIDFTNNFNYLVIAISGLITLGLLYLARNAQE